MKVYCKDCKWFFEIKVPAEMYIDSTAEKLLYECNSPEKYIDTFKEKIFYGRPFELNKNNDCPFYEALKWQPLTK